MAIHRRCLANREDMSPGSLVMLLTVELPVGMQNNKLSMGEVAECSCQQR
jgi:hypothetical protein